MTAEAVMKTVKATPVNIQKGTSVALARLAHDEDFWFRAGGLNDAHKADLASTIRNSGRALDPLLLWKPEGTADGGKLIVLDGAHRIAAYHSAGWQGEVPAVILVGVDRRTALGAALKANSKRTLGLSQAERTDAAWRLVREPVTPRFKVREIAQLADVAGRTVDYMRQRFRTMHEEGISITGSWVRDRRSLPEGEDADWLSDAQRKAEIDRLAGDIRDLLDRRKHPERAILRESEAVWEAMHVALGENAMKSMLTYLLAGEDEEANEWLEMAKAGRDAVNDEGEGYAADPAF